MCNESRAPLVNSYNRSDQLQSLVSILKKKLRRFFFCSKPSKILPYFSSFDGSSAPTNSFSFAAFGPSEKKKTTKKKREPLLSDDDDDE